MWNFFIKNVLNIYHKFTILSDKKATKCTKYEGMCMSRKGKILSRVSLCHHMMLWLTPCSSCDANLCKRYEAIICYNNT